MLTSKERITRILQHQPVDRVGLFEVFWKETAEKWAGEGRLEKPEMVSEHFGQDIRRAGGEITPMAWRLVNPVADLDAGDTIVEESDTVKLVRNGNGALLRCARMVPARPSTSISWSRIEEPGRSTFGPAC